MFVLGTMACQDQNEFDSIMGQLRLLPVEVKAIGLDITVEYEPNDRQSDHEVSVTVVRLLDIVESVQNHGISRVEKRG